MKNWIEIVTEEKKMFTNIAMSPSNFESMLLSLGLLAHPDGKPGMIPEEQYKNKKPAGKMFIWNGKDSDVSLHTSCNPWTGQGGEGTKGKKGFLGTVTVSGDASRVKEADAIIAAKGKKVEN